MYFKGNVNKQVQVQSELNFYNFLKFKIKRITLYFNIKKPNIDILFKIINKYTAQTIANLPKLTFKIQYFY